MCARGTRRGFPPSLSCSLPHAPRPPPPDAPAYAPPRRPLCLFSEKQKQKQSPSCDVNIPGGNRPVAEAGRQAGRRRRRPCALPGGHGEIVGCSGRPGVQGDVARVPEPTKIVFVLKNVGRDGRRAEQRERERQGGRAASSSAPSPPQRWEENRRQTGVSGREKQSTREGSMDVSGRCCGGERDESFRRRGGERSVL